VPAIVAGLAALVRAKPGFDVKRPQGAYEALAVKSPAAALPAPA